MILYKQGVTNEKVNIMDIASTDVGLTTVFCNLNAVYIGDLTL